MKYMYIPIGIKRELVRFRIKYTFQQELKGSCDQKG